MPGKHARKDPSDTHLFGLFARPETAGEPEPYHEPDATAWDLTDVLRAVPADMDETTEMPAIPEPEPPEYPAGPDIAALRWFGLAAAVALVLLLSVSCSLFSGGSGSPAAYAGRPVIGATAEPEPDEPAESLMPAPEPAATGVRTIIGPTVTVRPMVAQRPTERVARPVPTVTVTRTVSPTPRPAVTVTQTAFSSPEPAPTVTVTQTVWLPRVLPSP
jgi:hypothetical protein